MAHPGLPRSGPSLAGLSLADWSLVDLPSHGLGFLSPETGQGRDRLGTLTDFGSNPGALIGRTYVPEGLVVGAPLVVVLHGCTQSAAEYDYGAGWSQMADALGFAVLFPQQSRSNNPNLCFNWFSPIDARRGSGEPLSIRQMIAAMVATHAIDERRIFISGLSAGGAMASTMLATYPEVFAGGAIIAGLPYGAAASVGDAFARMRGEGYPAQPALTDLARAASDHNGPWPLISVWQGTADQTVSPSNAERIVGQWQGLHDVVGVAPERDVMEGADRRIWRDAAGRPVIEAYGIARMGHGTPVAAQGPDGCGASGPFMLEAGISSTRHSLRLWGLMDEAVVRSGRVDHRAQGSAQTSSRPSGVGGLIEETLRKAGLMR